jgi:methylthioribose-1-phosphate isomerase
LRPIKWENHHLYVLDQRLLPTRSRWVEIKGADDAFNAIRSMVVRGAPLIGVVAAFGLALELEKHSLSSREEFVSKANEIKEYLATARPTAVNLRWALEREYEVLHKVDNISDAKEAVIARAVELMNYEEQTSRLIGEYGEKLIDNGDTVLTHCNAGSLATVEYGTALAPIRFAIKNGKNVKVIATETRPALQGARLTAYELMKDGIDVTLISDTMVGYTLSLGMVDKIFVGADRVLNDGHVINKIGTYQIAVLALRHNVPFYSAMPWSSIDMESKLSEVKIEQRNPLEVETVRGRRIAPKGIKVFNPAFDITPPELVTAIVTDRGIIYPPYSKGLYQAHKKGSYQPVIVST